MASVLLVYCLLFLKLKDFLRRWCYVWCITPHLFHSTKCWFISLQEDLLVEKNGMQRIWEIMDNKAYVLDEILLLMIQKQTNRGHANTKEKQKHKLSTSRRKQPAGQRRTVLMNMRRKKNIHSLTLMHTQTHLPCVSVDWVNQPNFPFFFSVRSASVTPWCYQHAVHTARQQRKQWVSTEQRGGGYGKRQLQYKLQYRHSYHVQKSYKTSVYDIVKSSWHNRLTAKSEPGLCCPATAKIIQYIHF